LSQIFGIISNIWRFTQIENVSISLNSAALQAAIAPGSETPMANDSAEPIGTPIDTLWAIVVE
jgi:hypothetical protein